MWLLLASLACTGSSNIDSGGENPGDCTTSHASVGTEVPLVGLTDGTSGSVEIVDDCSVIVRAFTFTYTDELDTRWELWLDELPALVPDAPAVNPPVSDASMRLFLPTDTTHDDWDQVSLFDPALNVLHAYARP